MTATAIDYAEAGAHIRKVCPICKSGFSKERFDKLPLIRTKDAPDGITIDEGVVYIWRRCPLPCGNTLVDAEGRHP